MLPLPLGNCPPPKLQTRTHRTFSKLWKKPPATWGANCGLWCPGVHPGICTTTPAPSISREYGGLDTPGQRKRPIPARPLRIVVVPLTECAVKALVLTGSIARTQASFVPQGTGWKALGDAEFLLILPSRTSSACQLNLQRDVDRALLSAEINCDVTISPGTITSLERMEPRIFSYELRTMGRVVWGDPGILARIPNFSASEIERADAWERCATG